MAMSLKESLESLKNQTSAYTPAVMMLEPDTEPEITVDMDNRTITVPSELQTIGVATENNAETVYIHVPSITFDGIDLTDKTAYIYFVNAGKEVNIYKVTDVTVENNSIKLGWTITNDVTRYAGTVSFSIAFELDNSYKLTTTPATLTVLKGLDIDQTISKQDTAIVSALYDKVNALNTKVDNAVNSMDNSVATINSLQSAIQSLQSELNYMKEHVVYVIDDIEN